jgi:hypothetical protein
VTWWPYSNCVLWLRPTDYVVGNGFFGGYTWVWDGIIPVAAPNADTHNFVQRKGSVPQVEMYKLEWPALMQEQLHMVLFEKAFGPRYRQLASRRRVLNPLVWANFLAKKMQLTFHVQFGCFVGPAADGNGFEKLTMEKLMSNTAHQLQLAAEFDPAGFPTNEIRLPRIKHLIEAMKVAVAVSTPGEQDTLAEFLDECLEQRAGGDVTVAELYAAYTDYCHGKAVFGCPRSIFERTVPALVRARLGSVKSHDLRRAKGDGALTWHRGFHGLGLRVRASGDPAARPDGADSPDAADASTKNPDEAIDSAEHQKQPETTPPPPSAAPNTPPAEMTSG